VARIGQRWQATFAGIGGRFSRGEEKHMTIDHAALLRQGDVLIVSTGGEAPDGPPRLVSA
jgi:hypothetical protein